MNAPTLVRAGLVTLIAATVTLSVAGVGASARPVPVALAASSGEVDTSASSGEVDTSVTQEEDAESTGFGQDPSTADATTDSTDTGVDTERVDPTPTPTPVVGVGEKLMATTPTPVVEADDSVDPDGAEDLVAEEDVLSTLLDEEEDYVGLGLLEVTPATGTDTTEITVRTPVGCAAPADVVQVVFISPGAAEDGSDLELAVVAGPTDEGFSTTAPISVPLEFTFAEAAEEFTDPLAAGTYVLALFCVVIGDEEDEQDDDVSGILAAPIFFTSPTAYQLTDPNPTPTPTPSPTPAQLLPTPTPAPSPTPGIVAVASGNPTLAYTGAPVVELFSTGAGLSALGAAFLFAGRRRAVRRSAAGDPS